MNQPSHPPATGGSNGKHQLAVRGSSRRRSNTATLTLPVWMLLAALLSATPASDALAADAANRQQAIDMALQQNRGGKVLGVRTLKNNNGETVFAVKVLSNGRVRVFQFRKAQ